MPSWVRLALALALLALVGGNEEAHGHFTHHPAEDQGVVQAGSGAVMLPPVQQHAGEETAGEHAPDHGGHDEGHHKAAQPDAANLSVAAMLLGSVIFNMSLFYLVNHRDPDIKAHSWAVVSSTIAIFVSVLVFNGMQGVMDAAINRWVAPLVPEQVVNQVLILLRYVEFVIWYAVMYATLIRQARRRFNQRTLDTAGEIQDAEREADTNQMMTCWSTLFAHMAGFAAMSGGSALQSYSQFGEVPVLSLVPVVITALLEFLMFQLVDVIVQRACQGDPKEVIHMVDEFGDEAETEIGGLSLSFLTVQSLTFIVTGELRTHGGGGHHSGPPPIEPVSHTVMMIILALVFVILTGIMVWASSKAHLTESLPHMGKISRRWLFLLETLVAMNIAWCLLNAFKWEVSRFLQMGLHAGDMLTDPHSTIHHVLLALSVSFASISMVFVLDYIHDLDSTGDLADKAIKKVIMAIGILIGFSWEEAFNAGCDAFASLAPGFWGTVLLKFVLGCTVAVVVVPAWRLYILRNTLLEEKKARASHGWLLNLSSTTHSAKPQQQQPAPSSILPPWMQGYNMVFSGAK